MMRWDSHEKKWEAREDDRCACGGEPGTVTFSAHLSYPDMRPFRRRRIHDVGCCRDEPDEYGERVPDELRAEISALNQRLREAEERAQKAEMKAASVIAVPSNDGAVIRQQADEILALKKENERLRRTHEPDDGPPSDDCQHVKFIITDDSALIRCARCHRAILPLYRAAEERAQKAEADREYRLRLDGAVESVTVGCLQAEVERLTGRLKEAHAHATGYCGHGANPECWAELRRLTALNDGPCAIRQHRGVK